MLIAIPSKGRAGQTKSDKVLPSGVLYVPESEAHQYEQFNKAVVAVPSSVRGITATRNWILKNTDERWVVFVDDDVKNQGWVKLLDQKIRHIPIGEPLWIKVYERLFDSVESMRWKIWGIATQGAARSVYPYRPILFRSYVTASCMGIVNDGSMYFDESFPVKEDYEICLRHIKEYGGILAARFVYWENSHWGDSGGCKDYRTQKIEADCIAKLIRLYPGMIRQVTRGGSGYSIELEF
jgi:glycosyltransferase involved in cell wall biosynthesis